MQEGYEIQTLQQAEA